MQNALPQSEHNREGHREGEAPAEPRLSTTPPIATGARQEPRPPKLIPCVRNDLGQLRCPACGHSLQSNADRIECTNCPESHPIVEGIPRITGDQHLASFGRQWNKYEVAHDDEDRATFQAKTGISLAELNGLRVLDAGCGGGRYSKVCGEAGADVIGADHSAAVSKARQLCAHLSNVSFVQADLKRLPLEPRSFDFVFSIGVMHHDANTKAVFDAVERFVKPGGRYSVWLYRRNQWWQETINNALRRRTTIMAPEKLERWCEWGAWLGGLPLVNKTANKIVNFSAHPNHENRVCDTFDWYAPQYQFHHTAPELCGWFAAAGFDQIQVLPPEKQGRLYRWAYEHNLLIGSGVNVTGIKR